jgi:hypothetical protein
MRVSGAKSRHFVHGLLQTWGTSESSGRIRKFKIEYNQYKKAEIETYEERTFQSFVLSCQSEPTPKINRGMSPNATRLVPAVILRKTPPQTRGTPYRQ